MPALRHGHDGLEPAGKGHAHRQISQAEPRPDTLRDDDLLDRIDEIVPPGIDVAALEGAAHSPPAITQAALRSRASMERGAA